jgi:hypothetical protein
VAPCRISIHAAVSSEALFHIDIAARHTARPQFCFERPGDAIRALEVLSLGRRFGDDAVATQQALLQHDDFQRLDELSLRLVLQDGTARLEAISDDGRQRTCYLHGDGVSGRVETRSRWAVWRESWAEERRRFPVTFILFAGLPVFIGFFRLGGMVWRRLRP